jgi:hypothetical protein
MSEPENGTDFDPLRQIALLAKELWLAGGGQPVPAQAELVARMRRPRIGDLVVEVSSFRGFDPDGLGWLRELTYATPGRTDLVDCYVVEPLHRPGETQNWRNAEFIAVPTDRASQWQNGDDYWLERTGYTRAQLDALCECGQSFGKHGPSGYITCRGFRPAAA